MSSHDDKSHSEQERQHYGITFAVLALAGASYALLQSAVAPALPAIQEDLHASATATAWLLTGYLLSASVLTRSSAGSATCSARSTRWLWRWWY